MLYLKNISDYHTLKGYAMLTHQPVTSAMEDYLEMIVRLHKEDKALRISILAERLNVKTSSASKMVSNLKSEGLVDFEKYGIISLTKKGETLGEYLIFRHNLLNRFFCMINHTEDELELVEKVEHFIDEKTIHNLETFLNFVENFDLSSS